VPATAVPFCIISSFLKKMTNKLKTTNQIRFRKLLHDLHQLLRFFTVEREEEMIEHHELKRITEKVVVANCKGRPNVADHDRHSVVVSQVLYQGPLVGISSSTGDKKLEFSGPA
jgi:hypothetical protein